MRFTIRDLLWLTVVVALGVGGCSWGSANSRKPRAAFVLPESAAEARVKLLVEIPPGTSMEQARGRLDSFGFQVGEIKGNEFSARLDGPARGMVTTNWLVEASGDKGKLMDLSVRVLHTGP